MYEVLTTEETEFAAQTKNARSRRFSGESWLSKQLLLGCGVVGNLGREGTSLSGRGKKRLCDSANGEVQPEESARFVNCAAFLPKSSLAIKLLQMKLMPQIQTDKYED
jgi:hypothetical protein